MGGGEMEGEEQLGKGREERKRGNLLQAERRGRRRERKGGGERRRKRPREGKPFRLEVERGCVQNLGGDSSTRQ